MSMYDFLKTPEKGPGRGVRICITSRQLLTGTGEYSEEVCSRMLHRLSLIADNRLADAVILREKDLSFRQYRALAEAAGLLCQKKGLPLILHRFSQAACSFTPVMPLHLGMEDFLALKEQEREGLFPEGFPLLGVSVHTVEEALTAQRLGADYVTASHIFPTACKPGLPPRGLSWLKEVCSAVTIPVYALGGIHPEQEASCLAAGAAGVCMMSEYFRRDAGFIFKREKEKNTERRHDCR